MLRVRGMVLRWGAYQERGLAPAALGEHDAAEGDLEQAASLSPRYRTSGDDGGSDAGGIEWQGERGGECEGTGNPAT